MAEVTVAGVLAMPVLRAASPVVVAGAAGLDRPVRWVHSAELADIASLLREGDLLLSTGIAMPDTSAELAGYAASLAGSGAVGLVVELGRRWTRLPEPLRSACEEHALPLVALDREVRFAAVAQAVGERIVDEQVRELREAQRVHETFTALSIAESGPREILDAVQRLAGTTVVLESEEHQVLDYRSGPDDAAEFLTGWPSRSRAVALEQRTRWDRTQGWLVTRVGRRERGWGRLVVQATTAPSERLVAVAERAAAALALHRLHDRQRDGAVRRLHHELLLGLLADAGDAELWRRCELAGVPLARRRLVGLTVRPRFADAGRVDAAVLLEEAMAATIRAAHALTVPALVCEVDRDVRALLSVPAGRDADAVTDRLAATVRRRLPLTVAAGRPVDRAGDADRTLRESQHVMTSVREPGHDADGAVHRLEDVHLRGLLALLVDDDRVRLFVRRELDRLREHDASQGTALLAAVRALVEHPGGKSEAAASLHLSRPVFYDRLRKAERVLGASLEDPDLRVSLHVALLAAEVADA